MYKEFHVELSKYHERQTGILWLHAFRVSKAFQHPTTRDRKDFVSDEPRPGNAQNKSARHPATPALLLGRRKKILWYESEDRYDMRDTSVTRWTLLDCKQVMTDREVFWQKLDDLPLYHCKSNRLLIVKLYTSSSSISD